MATGIRGWRKPPCWLQQRLHILVSQVRILIVGDSFAVPVHKDSWSVKLSTMYNTVNLSQAGCTEYHIMKQLESIDVKDFNFIIVCHTSPYRIYVPQHPIHTEGMHKDAGLLLNDIEYHGKLIRNWFNKSLHAARNFIKYHYSEQYQLDIYNLIKNKISNIITTHNRIEMSWWEDDDVGLQQLLSHYPGTINHLTMAANQILLEQILEKIKHDT